MYVILLSLAICQAETLPPPLLGPAHWDSVAAAYCSSYAMPLPDEVPEPLQKAVERFAKKHDIYTAYCWSGGQNANEINWTRQHFLRNYPPRSDLKRLPPKEDVRKRLFDSKRHTERLNALKGILWQQGDIDQMIRDSMTAIRPWNLLAEAQTHEFSNNLSCRAALEELRNTIGIDDYNVGLMPLHIPESHWPRR